MKILQLIFSIIICIASIVFAGVVVIALPLGALSDSSNSSLAGPALIVLALVAIYLAMRTFMNSLKIARSLKANSHE